MDHFMEEVVVKRNRTMQNIAHMFATITMFVAAVLGVFMLQVQESTGMIVQRLLHKRIMHTEVYSEIIHI